MACLHCPSVFQGLKGFLCHTLMFCLPRDATGRVAISGLFSQMAVDPGRGWFRPLGFCGDLAPLWAGRPDDRRGIPAGCREGSQGWPAHAGRPLECVNKQHPHPGRGAGNRGDPNHSRPAHPFAATWRRSGPVGPTTGGVDRAPDRDNHPSLSFPCRDESDSQFSSSRRFWAQDGNTT